MSIVIDDTSLADGQLTFEGGMDSSRMPHLIGSDQYVYAKNLTNRDACLRTRPPFIKRVVEYADNSQSIFENGRFQGAATYYPTSGRVLLTVMVSGLPIIFDVTNEVKGIQPNMNDLQTNETLSDEAWFCQAGKYMVIQDGSSIPLILDGTGVRRANRPGIEGTAEEVPTGQEMAFGLGRLIVSNGRNYYVGDPDISSDPTNVIKFTEILYYENGGGFAIPVNMGDILGMVFQATSDTATGQGNLFIVGESGAVTTNLSVPRSQWPTTQLQTVALTNIGGTGDFNLVTVNNDIYFRSPDGVRSYRQARAQEQGYGKTPISAEVKRILDQDAKPYLRRCSAAVWDNYHLMTCRPGRDSKGIYFLGMTALNFETTASMTNKTPPAWCGYWKCDYKILQVLNATVNNEERCFIFARDKQDKNCLLEIRNDAHADLLDEETPIRWSLETRRMNYQTPFTYKKLRFFDIWFDDIIGEVGAIIQFRNDQNTCWQDWHQFCVKFATKDCSESVCNPSTMQPGFTSLLRMPETPDACDDTYALRIGGKTAALKRPMKAGFEHQIKISGSGHMQINRYLLHAEKIADDIPACPSSICVENFNACCVDDDELPPPADLPPGIFTNTEQQCTVEC